MGVGSLVLPLVLSLVLSVVLAATSPAHKPSTSARFAILSMHRSGTHFLLDVLNRPGIVVADEHVNCRGTLYNRRRNALTKRLY